MRDLVAGGAVASASATVVAMMASVGVGAAAAAAVACLHGCHQHSDRMGNRWETESVAVDGGTGGFGSGVSVS